MTFFSIYQYVWIQFLYQIILFLTFSFFLIPLQAWRCATSNNQRNFSACITTRWQCLQFPWRGNVSVLRLFYSIVHICMHSFCPFSHIWKRSRCFFFLKKTEKSGLHVVFLVRLYQFHLAANLPVVPMLAVLQGF